MPQKSSEIGEKRRKGKDKMIERKKNNKLIILAIIAKNKSFHKIFIHI